jgi:hypothetical protein
MSQNIRITDYTGTSIRLRVGLDLGSGGVWHALDFGGLTFTRGNIRIVTMSGHWFENDMYICDSDDEWLIKIQDFNNDWTGPNNDGDGQLLQGGALSLKPGAIQWEWGV